VVSATARGHLFFDLLDVDPVLFAGDADRGLGLLFAGRDELVVVPARRAQRLNLGGGV